MNKEQYKELRKKLKDKFQRSKHMDYEIAGSVGEWLKQCDIIPSTGKLKIICTIFGSIPYPYQEKDRKFIITFLRENKYKDFKKRYNSTHE